MDKQNEFQDDFAPQLLDNAILCGMSAVGQDKETGAIICAYSKEPEKSLEANPSVAKTGFAIFDVKNGIKNVRTAYNTLIKNMTAVYFDLRGQFRAEFRRQFVEHTGDANSLKELDGTDIRNAKVDTPLSIYDINCFLAEVFGKDPYNVRDLSRRAESYKQVAASAGITTQIDDILNRARQSGRVFEANKLKSKQGDIKEKEMGE